MNLPPKLWGADPLFNCNIKVFVSSILRMESYPDVPESFFHHGHPVSSVEVCGIVVSVDRKEGGTAFTVDDGTGTINCMQWAGDTTALFALGKRRLELASLVRVRGRLGYYNSEPQLTVSSLYPENSLNAELLFWLECVQLSKAVYQKPCGVPQFFLQNGEGGQEEDAHPGVTQEDVFLELVTEHISGLPLHPDGHTLVHYADLRACKKLQEAARPCLAQSSPIPEDVLMSKLFSNTMARLVKDGVLIVRDLDKDIYEMVSLHKIGSEIIQYLSSSHQALPLGPVFSGGVRRDELVSHVARGPYCNVRRARVIAAIEQLETDSVIYEVVPGVYRLVDG